MTWFTGRRRGELFWAASGAWAKERERPIRPRRPVNHRTGWMERLVKVMVDRG